MKKIKLNKKQEKFVRKKELAMNQLKLNKYKIIKKKNHKKKHIYFQIILNHHLTYLVYIQIKHINLQKL